MPKRTSVPTGRPTAQRCFEEGHRGGTTTVKEGGLHSPADLSSPPVNVLLFDCEDGKESAGRPGRTFGTKQHKLADQMRRPIRASNENGGAEAVAPRIPEAN